VEAGGVLWLRAGGSRRAVDRRRTGRASGSRKGRPRIRCPKCQYEPTRSDRWTCVCFHVWNTFDTHGVCPGCGLGWSDTCCPRCRQWSRHDDWYEDGADRDE
jgi:hypothetical protein